MSQELQLLEQLRKQAEANYRLAFENCKDMKQQAYTIGDGNPDSTLMQVYASQELSRATHEWMLASEAYTLAVLRTSGSRRSGS